MRAAPPTHPTGPGRLGKLARAIETKLTPLAFSEVSADGVFEGYASLFEQEDLGHDVVAPGAFRRSLEARGTAGVRMLFQHDPAQPLGTWLRLHEDARGLFARGRLALEVAKAREVHALMKAGALDGLSIGFRVIEGRRDRRTGIRRLQQIDLWEVSIVTFPMQPAARVRRVKAAPRGGGDPSASDLERWLMRDAGLSLTEARAVMRDGLQGLASLHGSARSPRTDRGLIAQIEEAARLLRQR